MPKWIDREAVEAAVAQRTTRPCPACDQIGPDESKTIADFRAAHRALHDYGRALWDETSRPVGFMLGSILDLSHRRKRRDTAPPPEFLDAWENIVQLGEDALREADRLRASAIEAASNEETSS